MRAVFLAVMGFFSLWSIMNDLGTGNATSRTTIINVRENPGGFYLVVFCKAVFVSFAIAAILNAFGLIGDPFVWFAQTFPFLVRKQAA